MWLRFDDGRVCPFSRARGKARAAALVAVGTLGAPTVLSPLACSSPSSGTIQIVVPSPNPLTTDPAPSWIEVDAVDDSGSQVLVRTSLPASSLDLGSLDPNETATLTVTAGDDAGTRLAYGESLPIQLGVLDGTSVPVFVQRTGALALLPSALSDARTTPLLDIVDGRFLYIGGGDDPSLATTAQLYDFLALAPLGPAIPSLPAAKSVAFVGYEALMIDANGNATTYDFSTTGGNAASVAAPAGASFADVAGGATVYASDGTAYVVGATRTTGMATNTVLILPSATATASSSASPSWAFLSSKRLGAAAAWVDARGLVVCGGSGDPTASGVEIIPPGLTPTSAAALPYATDATMGAGARMLDADDVLLAGGVSPSGQEAGVRVVDLGCEPTSTMPMCAPLVWTALPVPLASADVFPSTTASTTSQALVVGNEAADGGPGATHAFVVSNGSATELSMREAHQGARAIVSPLGSVVVFGGASQIESFYP